MDCNTLVRSDDEGVERLQTLLNEAESVLRRVVQQCPWSADMRLLHVAAFHETTDQYDGLDDIKYEATSWLSAKGDLDNGTF